MLYVVILEGLFINKKLYIFDLDNTIYLRKVKSHSQTYYHNIIKDTLLQLKTNGKTLCLASHNVNCIYCLKTMNIYHLFDYIIGEYPRSKDTMVIEILDKTGYKKNNVIFFDDLLKNINIVSNIGINCYLIKSKFGILEIIFDKYNIKYNNKSEILVDTNLNLTF